MVAGRVAGDALPIQSKWLEAERNGKDYLYLWNNSRASEGGDQLQYVNPNPKP